MEKAFISENACWFKVEGMLLYNTISPSFNKRKKQFKQIKNLETYNKWQKLICIVSYYLLLF